MSSPSKAVLEPSVLELLASRICHDLISPVGAIHNGVEFMEDMGPESAPEALQLIAHSANQAAARLQIFRLAYGAGGRDPNIKPEDVKKTFAALVDADGKVKQDWDPKALTIGDMPAGFCKLLTGLLILAQESMPKGGTIGVTSLSPSALEVTATGPDANIRAGVESALAQETPVADLDPRLVHPYVVGLLAGTYGFTLVISEQTAGRVVFKLGRA